MNLDNEIIGTAKTVKLTATQVVQGQGQSMRFPSARAFNINNGKTWNAGHVAKFKELHASLINDNYIVEWVAA